MPDMNLEDLLPSSAGSLARLHNVGTDSSWFPRGFVVSYFEEQLRISDDSMYPMKVDKSLRQRQTAQNLRLGNNKIKEENLCQGVSFPLVVSLLFVVLLTMGAAAQTPKYGGIFDMH